jgi:hypothetical protein
MLPITVEKNGVVAPVRKDNVDNNAILKNKARKRPNLLVLLCCACGSLFTVREIKMMLSIPNTISKNVRVNKVT